MALIDFILNLMRRAGALVELAFRKAGSIHFQSRLPPLRWSAPCARPIARTRIVGYCLASFSLLILVRALAYWEICGPAHVTPAMDLGVVYLSIRSDHLFHMLLFSILSFALTLAGFYFWMLLLSVVNFKIPNTDKVPKMRHLYLSWWEA